MTTRILPVDEWPKLAGTELERVWPVLSPDDARIVVVEDANGQIVGCWAAIRYVHAEGVWIHPTHRGKSSVARRLMRGLRAAASEFGATAVMTTACTADVADLVAHFRGAKLPGDHYAVSLGGS